MRAALISIIPQTTDAESEFLSGTAWSASLRRKVTPKNLPLRLTRSAPQNEGFARFGGYNRRLNKNAVKVLRIAWGLATR